MPRFDPSVFGQARRVSSRKIVARRAASFQWKSGRTGLQIVYPATQAQPKRERLLIEKIAEAFSSPSS
jgi:hypothetical protein